MGNACIKKARYAFNAPDQKLKDSENDTSQTLAEIVYSGENHIQINFPYAGQYKHIESDSGVKNFKIIDSRVVELHSTNKLKLRKRNTPLDHLDLTNKAQKRYQQERGTDQRIEQDSERLVYHVTYQNPKRTDQTTLYERHSGYENALCLAALHAYNTHLGLELSPNIIWMAIAQAIVLHVDKYSDHYKKLTDIHRCDLKFNRDLTDTKQTDWNEFVTDLYDQLTHKTKTSGPTEEFNTNNILSKIATAPTPETPHNTSLHCEYSGLILRGTIREWEQLLDKTLAKLSDLENYNKKNPYKIAKEKTQTYDNRNHNTPQTDISTWQPKIMRTLTIMIKTRMATTWDQTLNTFWSKALIQSVYEAGMRYKYIQGWLRDFFPYGRNLKFTGHSDHIDLTNIPSGKVSMPATIHNGENKTDIEIETGFISYRCNTAGYVSPQIGTIIYDKEKKNIQWNDSEHMRLPMRSTNVRSISSDESLEELKQSINEMLTRV